MLKQLSPEQVEQLNDDLMLQVEYHPINIDEELFELSKDKHLKKSFTKPRKKVKKRNYNYSLKKALLFHFQLVHLNQLQVYCK